MTEDSPYFDIVPAEPIEVVGRPNAIASGDGWFIKRQPDGLWLFYLSGEQGGGERAILIDDSDLAALRSGERTLDAVLIAHYAS